MFFVNNENSSDLTNVVCHARLPGPQVPCCTVFWELSWKRKALHVPRARPFVSSERFMTFQRLQHFRLVGLPDFTQSVLIADGSATGLLVRSQIHEIEGIKNRILQQYLPWFSYTIPIHFFTLKWKIWSGEILVQNQKLFTSDSFLRFSMKTFDRNKIGSLAIPGI